MRHGVGGLVVRGGGVLVECHHGGSWLQLQKAISVLVRVMTCELIQGGNRRVMV